MAHRPDIEALREAYADEGLSRSSINSDPFKQFETWFQQTVESGMPEPNAMVVGTASAGAAPSQRTVLLKSYDHDGFVFYTNYGSRKAEQMAENDQVSLIFPWVGLERQVIVEGRARKVSAAESLRYFSTRPRGSQLGAWASNQSDVISTRHLLEAKLDEMKQKFKQGDISLPSFWGGYRVKPHRIEFWQGRNHRLHDRFLFVRSDQSDWEMERLSP